MCEYKMKHWVAEGMPVTMTYDVLELNMETDEFWEVWLKPKRQFYNGKESDVNKPKILYCFPKRKEVGKNGDLVLYEDLPEPHFIKFIRPTVDFEDIPKIAKMPQIEEEQDEIPF